MSVFLRIAGSVVAPLANIWYIWMNIEVYIRSYNAFLSVWNWSKHVALIFVTAQGQNKRLYKYFFFEHLQ